MDVTSLVIEGQNARSIMQEAKRRNKAEVRRKYEAMMKAEIDEKNTEAEYAFAKTLARIHASGLSQAIIRRDVLRTNVWSTWTYWRDLAQILPERVSTRQAKEERVLSAQPFRRTGSEWVLVKDVLGNPLPEPLEMFWGPNGAANLDRPEGLDWNAVGGYAENVKNATAAVKAAGLWDDFEEDTK